MNDLQQALALRERIGDLAGAETTRKNLRVVNGRAPLLHRLSHLPIAMIAIVCAVLIGAGGVAGATVLTPGDSRIELSVGLQGDGRVVSDDGKIDCADAECRVERARGSELLLRPQPQRGWEFARWTAGCSGRSACRLLLTRDTRVVAQFKRVRDPREVTVIVQGQGTVVSHPAGISCRAGDRCQATFTRSRRLELTAAAAPGHRFAGWSGDCEGTRRCIIGGDARRVEVRAAFVADPHAVTLKVDVRGDGLGRVVSRESGIDCGPQCAAGFRRGTRVRLGALAQPGSRFAGWNDPACTTTTGSTCVVTADRSRTVVARFNRIDDTPPRPASPQPPANPPPPASPPPPPPPPPSSETLTVRVDGDGQGAVTSDPVGLRCSNDCTHDFPAGTQVELRASPLPGSLFAGWEGSACSGAGACVLRMDQARSVTASFAKSVELTVHVTANGTVTTEPPGTVTTEPRGIDCGPDCRRFAAGTSVTLSATAARGWDFDRWQGLDACKWIDTPKPPANQTRTVKPLPITRYHNPCTIKLDQDVTATATFIPARVAPP